MVIEKPREIRKVNIDTDQLKQIGNLYLSGVAVYKIAKEMHVPRRAMTICLWNMGFKPRRKLRKRLDLDLIKSLYVDKQLTAEEIAKQFHCSRTAICYRLHRMGCMRTDTEALKVAYARGRINQKKDSRKTCLSGGYIMIWKPECLLANKTGYVREHRLVWQETHNEPLPENWVVHHINGIKTDNRPDNLVAYPRGKHDKLIPLMAERIRKLEIENRQLQRALENSQMIFYVNEN